MAAVWCLVQHELDQQRSRGERVNVSAACRTLLRESTVDAAAGHAGRRIRVFTKRLVNGQLKKTLVTTIDSPAKLRRWYCEAETALREAPLDSFLAQRCNAVAATLENRRQRV
jgi:hypothetical protein